MVPKRLANKRTVAKALDDMSWIWDIYGIASAPVIFQFFVLCNSISAITLTKECRTSTFGGSPPGSDQQNQHMNPSFKAQPPSTLQSEFGNLGHQASAGSSSGWLHTTDVGQRTGWQKGTSHTHPFACCATRRKKP
ncbi:hypothetical protein PR202_ga13000 [Eleusine coracana subsp. coracana]|uniref:Uncharacterized protein n=1 Tax=Eleusine coracana subsp. coracana TaxID=191504 RepID=A0AAV5CDK6_ELECO|nr:hypothetical protein PR202_ga13000 [Eleusine coracana subsp. coracana]